MHVPVMLAESIEGLALSPGSVVADLTLGGAGHAEAILAGLGAEGVFIGIDRDPLAIERARKRLKGFDCANVNLRQANFSQIKAVAADLGVGELDAVLVDLGVSSFQLETPERGFSFRLNGPLDMRMDPGATLTAEQIVNRYEESEIAEILYRFGEERAARRIAKAIVAERGDRRIDSTIGLAEIIAKAKNGRRGRIHPATKSFMALRMAVNDELGSLEACLEDSLELLRPGGRMVVISFHSLEDRMVKKIFREHRGRSISLHAGGERWEGRHPRVELIVRKPIEAGRDELRENPRARSAKLRIVERCA